MDLHKKSYSELEKDYFLFLVHQKGVGRKTIYSFIKFLIIHEQRKTDFWVVVTLFFTNKTKHNTFYKRVNKTAFEQNIYSIKKRLKNSNIRVCFFFDKTYPKQLLETDDFPVLLFYKGSISVLLRPSLAVVGSRKMTYYGKQVISAFVPDLVAAGITIVSGAMYGVDIAAHRECLEKAGKTVAVLGYGFEKEPGYVKPVLQNIIKNAGCILTEYPPGTSATKGTFPERNRIVAGLCFGVLVIEAAQKSGTHITVNCALAAGREVFAIPGPVFNPYSEGTKYLLNSGAVLVSSVSDILTELPELITMPSFQHSNEKEQADFDAYLEAEILRELSASPRNTADLARVLEVKIPELLVHLSMLELKNKIVKDADYWQLVIS